MVWRVGAHAAFQCPWLWLTGRDADSAKGPPRPPLENQALPVGGGGREFPSWLPTFLSYQHHVGL